MSKRKGLTTPPRLPQPGHHTLHFYEGATAFLTVSESAYINPELLLLFSCQVVSNGLRPHGLSHTKLPCSSPSPRVSSLTSLESVMPFNRLIPCLPLFLPSIFPSIRVFSNESALLIRWPKYWSFSFSISLSSEYSWLISLRID